MHTETQLILSLSRYPVEAKTLSDPAQCPRCGWIGEYDDFDSIGAAQLWDEFFSPEYGGMKGELTRDAVGSCICPSCCHSIDAVFLGRKSTCDPQAHTVGNSIEIRS